MYAFILRKLLYSIPVYLGIILVVMLCLRVNDPVSAYLGKNASAEQIKTFRTEMKLDNPLIIPFDADHYRKPIGFGAPSKDYEEAVRIPGTSIYLQNPIESQYFALLWRIVRLDFSERSWERKQPVGEILASAVLPSLSIALPALFLTTIISICVAMLAAYYRGSLTDRVLMFCAVLGMSISLLVYVIFGQYFGAYYPQQHYGVETFAISGYKPFLEPQIWWLPLGFAHLPIPYPTNISPFNWVHYCLLPVIITVLLDLGYETRFYRAVMVEETSRDYIVTAKAKGASKPKIMFVHMLKNAMIPIITTVMITLPFLITGSIVIEQYFLIPGMGRTLITAVVGKDFPVVQAFTAVFAAVFIATNILTDVLYALVDPRVRLS